MLASLFWFSTGLHAKEFPPITYKFHNDRCTDQIVKQVEKNGISLVFATVKGDMPLLVGVVNKGASLSNKLKFTKEGVDGWDNYMSLDSTEYSYNKHSYTLQQLWLRQRAAPDNAPTTSGFYLDDKCLVSTVPMSKLSKIQISS